MREGPFQALSLSFSFSSPSLPPSSLPFPLFSDKSQARQVGSLLRNGFPDFFAVIKGSRAREGVGQRDLRHETGLDGLPDTVSDQLLLSSEF